MQIGKQGKSVQDLQIGKQCKPVQIHKFASSVNRALFTSVAHQLVGATAPIPIEQ